MFITNFCVFIHAFLSFRFQLVKPSTVHILDGMAIMQMVESSGATFGDLFLKYFDILTTPLPTASKFTLFLISTKRNLQNFEREKVEVLQLLLR